VTTPDLGTHEELTVAAWFKVTGRVGSWRVLYNVDGWSTGWLHHQLYPDNRLGYSINSNPGGDDRQTIARFDATAVDVWHHSAAVYSSHDASLKLYINGVLDSQYSWGGNPVALRPGRIGGWSGGGRAFQGSIDEVVFLDFAASPTQVIDLMNQPIGGSSPFQITEVTLESGSLDITWNSRPGRFYRIEWSVDAVTWSEVDDSYPSGGESTTYSYEGGVEVGPVPDPETTPLIFLRVGEVGG